jgi:hypothetical protein
MSPINLVPAAILERRAIRRRVRIWAIRLGVTIAVMAPLYLGLWRMAGARQTEVRRLTGHYALLQQRLTGAQGLIVERDSLATRRGVVERMRAGEPTSAYLEILGRALTPDSYLTVLSLERCDPAGDAPRSETEDAPKQECRSALRLRGRAPGNRQVGEILRGLAAAPELSEVTLVGTTDPGVAEGPPEVEFEIWCTLADDRAPAAAVGVGG